MNKVVSDQPKRDLSLDPTQSFIVQAPAGSGKTELLIQRFLVLLARVTSPEEVIAITFTRKAALEMRERILSALNKANLQPFPPEALHAQKTWQLARRVLEQDQTLSWHLLQNPGRLRVQTIDSLTHQIVRQTPLLAEFSPITEIAEDADWLYSLAVRNLFNRDHDDMQFRASLSRLLLHLNNDGGKLEGLLKAMLARRDQWLEHVVRPKEREHLEDALKKVNQKLLEQCCANFPQSCEGLLLELMRFSAHNKGDRENASLNKMPGSSVADKSLWQTISNFLLTKTFTFRENVNQSMGFPAESATQNSEERLLFKEMKTRFKSLIQALRPFESCRSSLQAIIESPALSYSEAQWQILSALTRVLKRLLAELKLVFHEKKRVDFVEMILAAREALGTDDQPTELALILDYKIQHLLMDEFQDTSMAQFKLVERLISGWQPGDGRTLFLVGDPMQSIYRFRQAEVGLFLIAQKKGIGNIPLTSVNLEVNFRSEAGLLAWVNQQFSQIFPPLEDIQLGAVSFFPSTAFHETQQSVSVSAHTVASEDEGEMLCSLIQEAWRKDPKHRVAILVRSRSHLDTIIPSLSKAGLKFHALDIAALREQPVIQDLYALTRVLLSPVDRLAWLSVLRAPWCGLTLEDLHRLVYRTPKWDFLKILASMPEDLSIDGRRRFLLTGQIIASKIALRDRESTTHWVQSVWLALKGPLCYPDVCSAGYAQDFFDLLEQLEKEMGFIDLERLDARLDKLFAGGEEAADERLQLMTIHKSKGLEFDSVIIPGLERKSKNDMPPILRWLEQAYLEEKSDLLLAPIMASGDEQDSIYQYLGFVEKNKQKHELVRLLYVAATRAKSCLHWVMRMNDADESDKSPPFGSLLSLLNALSFSAYSSHHLSMLEEQAVGEKVLKVRRLKSDYFTQDRLPLALGESDLSSVRPVIKKDRFYEKFGVVLHRLLDQMVRLGAFHKCLEQESLWKKWLIQEGFLLEHIPLAIEKIGQAIKNIRKDPMGQWIVDSSHQESHSEYALTLNHAGSCQHFRIDRTFLDAQGRRWIIDYKSTVPLEHQSIESFLEEMRSRYSEQLQRYGKAISALSEAPIFFGLYFPLIPAWCAWEYESRPIMS